MSLVLADIDPALVLVDPSQRSRLPGDIPVLVVDDLPGTELVDTTDPGLAVNPDQLAYVMYTSGSTGRPKGIGITHADVVELATDPRWASGAHDVCSPTPRRHSMPPPTSCGCR